MPESILKIATLAKVRAMDQRLLQTERDIRRLASNGPRPDSDALVRRIENLESNLERRLEVCHANIKRLETMCYEQSQLLNLLTDKMAGEAKG